MSTLRRTGGAVVLLGAMTLGCATDRGHPIPQPDVTGMEPQVAALLGEHRDGVVSAPSSAEAWGRLGCVYDAHGLFEPAESCYRRAAELAPEDFRWSYLLAVAREARGADADEVVRRFDRAATLDADYAPVHVRKGDALSTRGRYDAAAEAFRAAIALAPDTAVAHRGLGQVLLAADDVSGAIEHLERAVALQRNDRSAYAALAQAYLREGRAEEADQAVRRSTMLEPVHSMADPIYGSLVLDRSLSSSRVYSRAMGRLRRGEYENALADLEIVRVVRPDDASLFYWIGICLRGLDRRPDALRAFARAVELEGSLVRARLELARLLAESNQLDAAAEQAEQSVRLAPRDPAARVAMGRIRLAQGRAAEAVEHLLQAVELQPTNADLRHDLGRAYARLGRNADAIQHLEFALRLTPGHAAGETLRQLRGSSR